MNYYSLISSMNKISAPALDADCLAYLTAGSLLGNPTIENAYNDFFVGLKSDGVYSKITAMWTFQQSTSLTPKLNLVDPRDLDAAHRIAYYVSPTINSTGIDCTGGGADLKMTPSANLTLNDTHFSFDSATNANGTFYDIFSGACIQIFARLSNLFLSDMYNLSGGNGRILVANTSSIGFFTISRLTAPTHRLYINGSQVATNSTTDGTLQTGGIFLGCQGIGTNYSTRTYRFASVGLGLTGTDVSNLNTRVQTLMTALGR
jgi:hypothetical protein